QDSFSGQDRRGQLPNRMDITVRPLEADNRERLGDYEGDTVIGCPGLIKQDTLTLDNIIISRGVYEQEKTVQ
ncbi:hypothetical protein SNEBB_004687, partial [Seison nebaliae]